MPPLEWTLLIYKIPAQPSRLRVQIWRRLQRMGALYLQDAVCLLPDRPELTENMQYVAQTIEEMGGTYHLFTAQSIFSEGSERLVQGFRQLADTRYEEIAERIQGVESSIHEDCDLTALEAAEEELKRERVAYLKGKRLSYFGAEKETEVEKHLDTLRQTLDAIHRGDNQGDNQ